MNKYFLKILTLGESSVGKTCITVRYVDDKFTLGALPTIGVDYKDKTVVIDNNEIKLKIWDTAGQEKFKHLTKQYYSGADGILLVYDITNKISFKKLNDWMKDIESYVIQDKIGIIIVGNKSDLETERQVESSKGEEYAKKMRMKFIEVSALNNTGINEAFDYLIREIVDKKQKFGDSSDIANLSLSNSNDNSLKKCGC